MTPAGKVPRNPPAQLQRRNRDVVTVNDPVWRIHRTQGRHVVAWNGFRTYGPVSSARYDPHPKPAGIQPGFGVSYAASELATPVAEVFQTSRRINTIAGGPYATAWTPTRPLELLDLTGDWALANGAAHALAAAARPVCRTWSQAIRTTWPDLDGLWAPSTMTGAPMVVLYEPAATAMPDRPAFSQPLAAPVVWSVLDAIAGDIGYTLH